MRVPVPRAACAALFVLSLIGIPTVEAQQATDQQTAIALPKPDTRGRRPLEEVIAARRSMRRYSAAPLTQQQLSQILWAAQGITSPDGKRTAPSAGARYPLELYVAAARVNGVQPGVYRFVPKEQAIARVVASDVASCFSKLGNQAMLGQAAVVLLFAAVPSRIVRYGDRAQRFIAIEVGAAAQNVYLQAESLDLGTVAVGAADDPQVRKCIPLASGEQPVLLMPIGRRP